MNKAMGAARKHTISSFFVFCLIGIFAVLATTLTLFGVRAYRSVNSAAVKTTDDQIALSYLENKLHSGDCKGGIAIESIDGIQVLSLNEHLEGTDYQTRIYYSEGCLREYFCEADEPFDASSGDALAELEGFDIELIEPQLIKITITQQSGASKSAHISLRSGEVTAR